MTSGTVARLAVLAFAVLLAAAIGFFLIQRLDRMAANIEAMNAKLDQLHGVSASLGTMQKELQRTNVLLIQEREIGRDERQARSHERPSCHDESVDRSHACGHQVAQFDQRRHPLDVAQDLRIVSLPRREVKRVSSPAARGIRPLARRRNGPGRRRAAARAG
jgi:hypothetical protein